MDRGEVHADGADDAAADFGDADLQVDLQRRCHAQAADDVGAFTDICFDQRLGVGCIFGSGDRAGQEHRVGAHRGDVDLGLRHCQREHLVDAADVRTDADVGCPDDVACSVAGIDRGFTRSLAEQVQLALRLHLHIGDGIVRDEHIGHIAGHVDEFAAADRKDDLLARADDRLGRGHVRRDCCQRRERQAGEQQFSGKTTCHGMAP